MSLRSKLSVAFCSLLAILLAVGVMSVRTAAESSTALERILRENYDSVAACLGMKGSIDRLDQIAATSLWEPLPNPQRDMERFMLEFENKLRFQQGNVTIEGERELTDRLTELWKIYRGGLDALYGLPDSGTTRRDYFRKDILPQSLKVREAAQAIIELNLQNMVSADGQARQRARKASHTVEVLVFLGVVLAVIFIGVVGLTILRPIESLTRSVREIQQGNLDLVVNVRSRDEIGQLASAFNEMASSLRAFRRSDRALLLRTQTATQMALNSLSDAVVICDPGGEIELANEAAERLFGLKPESMIAEGHERISELFKRVRNGARPIHAQGYDSAIQIFKGGGERFYLPEGIPILDDSRQLIGVTLVLSDVTGMRRLDEVKSGLISTVSHELKTPLTSLRLATHVLLSEKLGPLNLKQAELLVTARDDSDRLFQIIENLLDIGRMESGRVELQLRSFPPEQLVLDSVEEMRSAFLDRGITLTIEIPSDLPAVLADELRLYSVFGNLLSNALKHTSAGGQVLVSARSEGSLVRFAVEDNGSGIPEEFLPHVFEKFFRVPGGQKQNDYGLGLAIVKEIIEAHGGSISVSSQMGKGTRFTFTLQAADGR